MAAGFRFCIVYGELGAPQFSSPPVLARIEVGAITLKKKYWSASRGLWSPVMNIDALKTYFVRLTPAVLLHKVLMALVSEMVKNAYPRRRTQALPRARGLLKILILIGTLSS